MSFAFRKLKQHQSKFRYWISSWLDILIIIGFRLQKKDTVEHILSKVKPNKVVYGQGWAYGFWRAKSKSQILMIYLWWVFIFQLMRSDWDINLCTWTIFKITLMIWKRDSKSICGDYNICHEAIDIHDPVEIKDIWIFTRGTSGWMLF
jgi:exodeoxyribonuclease-3